MKSSRVLKTMKLKVFMSFLRKKDIGGEKFYKVFSRVLSEFITLKAKTSRIYFKNKRNLIENNGLVNDIPKNYNPLNKFYIGSITLV